MAAKTKVKTTVEVLPKKHIKGINPIRLKTYKESRYRGASIKDALLSANYALSTATHRNGRTNGTKLVEIGENEIAEELRASDITPDFLVKDCEKAKAIALNMKKPELNNYLRGVELQGKFVGIGLEQHLHQTNVLTINNHGHNPDRLTEFLKIQNK